VKLCWIKLFVICTALALLLYYFFASAKVVFVMIPVAVFELVGYSLYLNELNENGAKLTFSRDSYYLMVLFWIVVTAGISWFVCKIKSFSKGSINE